jgi:hypothetical protein
MAVLAVDLAAMAYLDDDDNLFGLIYFIQDAVVTLANTIPFLTG